MDVTASSISHSPRSGRARLVRRLAAAALVALALAGCQADEVSFGAGPKHLRDVPSATRARMAELGMSTTSPVLMRIFKEENVFEVWKVDGTGRYALLKEFEICKWSGDLGPKFREGDRQAPEGYYTITPGLLNPNSSYHLAFNTGYPNAYDRSHGRTGSHLMVHGACSSRGCYAMTDAQIQEIYALARDAFRGGQKGFQLAAYPFRMTPENMARHIDSPHMPFWRMLKRGYDHFELTRREPKVDVCGRRYVFDAVAEGPMDPVAACPALTVPETLRVAVEKKAAEDEAKTMVIAARIAEEKKAAEEEAIMIAAREDDARRRAEERRVALADRRRAIASVLGLAGGEPAADDAFAGLPTVAADGRPLPRPAPREGNGALALAATAPAPAASGGSVFGRLFSFGDDHRPAAAGEAGSPVPVAEAPNPSSPAAVAAVAAVPPAAAAACPAGSGAGASVGEDAAGCTDVAVMAPPAAASGDRSIIDRIGTWF